MFRVSCLCFPILVSLVVNSAGTSLAELIDDSALFEPLSSYVDLPIDVERSVFLSEFTQEKVSMLVGMSDVCARVRVVGYESDIVSIKDEDINMGIARLECEVVEDYLGSRRRVVDVYLYHVTVPGKIHYAETAFPVPEDLVGRETIVFASRVRGHGAPHFLVLPDGILLVDERGDIVDPLGRLTKSVDFMGEIQRRANRVQSKSDLDKYDLIVVAEYVGVEGGLKSVNNGECVLFRVQRRLKGNCEDSLCVAGRNDAQSRVYNVDYIAGSRYLLLLHRETGSSAVLPFPRINSYLVDGESAIARDGEVSEVVSALLK